MKNLSILTVIISIFTFSSCEEESIIGCTDLTAINYDAAATESNNSCEYVSDQILGSWTLDSANVNMLYSEEMLNLLIIESSMYTPYEFEDEMGFPMPSSQTEWDYIALNGVPLDLDMSNFPDLILITNSTFTINESDEVTELDYQLINDFLYPKKLSVSTSGKKLSFELILNKIKTLDTDKVSFKIPKKYNETK